MAEQDAQASKTVQEQDGEATAKRAKLWLGRITAAKKKHKEYTDKWKENVSFRIMQPFESESETDRVATPDDWSRTRAKIASLYSATPNVSLEPLHPRYAPATPVFAKIVNHVLKHQAKPGIVMRECLPDLINASGICAAIVRYEATFTTQQAPAIDVSTLPPEQAMAMMQSGQMPMTDVEVPVSERFTMRRISPTQLLIPADFTGSDFNDADWIGYEGVMPWAVAKREFKLDDDDKEKVVGGTKPETLNDDQKDSGEDDRVKYQELYYWNYRFDADEKYLERIRKIVFVDGIKDRPVVDEDYQGQKFDDKAGSYIGVCILPIQVCTLAYVSDQAIPPSDSEIGRPSVLERMRSRSQMLLQRELSLPLRWADTSRVDPSVLENLQKGAWQPIIPTQGSGERAFGESARASYPREDWQFDGVINKDLDDAWSLSSNQMGNFASGERSASEANYVQQANSNRIGVERAQVVQFFLSLCEVLGGLVQLYYDPKDTEPIVGPDGEQRLQAWDMARIAGKFVYTITQDSTVLLDSEARIEKLMKALNLTGKSGYVNPEPIIAEVLSLSGIDPAQVMTKPNPPKPDDPNISLRLTGSEDLLNPVAIGFLIKSGQAPEPVHIAAAKQLIADAMGTVLPPTVPGQAPTQGGGPDKEWGPMERVTKRVDEMGG